MIKLKDILTEASQLPEKINIVYTEQGGRFYGTYVYSDANKSHDSKLNGDETDKYFKNMNIDVEVPASYSSGQNDLDMIVKKLQAKGIDASHGDYMDVS